MDLGPRGREGEGEGEGEGEEERKRETNQERCNISKSTIYRILSSKRPLVLEIHRPKWGWVLYIVRTHFWGQGNMDTLHATVMCRKRTPKFLAVC